MKYITHAIWLFDRVSEVTGKLLSWCFPLMIATTGLVVMLRYGFNLGSIALQELSTYLHAMAFLLGFAFTLKNDGHVRIDIFYRKASPRYRAWVDTLGSLVFLLPICVAIIGLSWEFTRRSWEIGEISPEPGGIPAVFLLKSFIPISALLLGLQGISMALKNTLTLLMMTEESH